MQYVDTHTHFFLEEFSADRDKTVDSAIKAGVTRMLIPNIDLASLPFVLDLCNKYPKNCFPAIGLHPSSVRDDWQDELNRMEPFLKEKKFYAVGETGMDLYWEKSFGSRQEKAFRRQIQWALTYRLPLSIHSRNAVREIIDIIGEMNDGSLKGVFHCYGGSIDDAYHIIGLGFMIGIGGVVTFKNSGLEKLVAGVPLKNILLETDSPYLAPVPFRGKRNESAYIPLIAARIAEIKNCSIQEVADCTTQNAINLFGF